MDIYELIGFIIGDGHIFYNRAYRKYKLELAGNVSEDYDYFEKIKEFLMKKANNKPQFFIRRHKKGTSLCLNLYDKTFVDKIIKLGIPPGKKTFTINIPPKITKKQETSVLRGLFEADGCLYFSKSKKNKYPTYPRVEIKTSSKKLLRQLKTILRKRGFAYYIRNPSSDRTFAIGISGESQLEKWIHEIGFSGLKNNTKYIFWKTKGFYIPHTPLKKRIKYAHVA